MTISHWVKLCHKIQIFCSIKKEMIQKAIFIPFVRVGCGQGHGMRLLASFCKNYIVPSQRFKSSWKGHLFTYCSTCICIWQNWQWGFLYQLLFFSPRKDFIIKAVRLLSISYGCMKKYCLDDALSKNVKYLRKYSCGKWCKHISSKLLPFW